MKLTDLKIRALEVMRKYGVDEVYATPDGNCFIPSVKQACEVHAKQTGQKIYHLKKEEILSEQNLKDVEIELKADLKDETVTDNKKITETVTEPPQMPVEPIEVETDLKDESVRDNKQITETVTEPPQTPAEPTKVETETTIKTNPKKLK